MNKSDERNVDPIQEMERIARSFLNIDLWGFKESYRSTKPGKLIFNSEWCRLNFIWDGWDYRGGNTISIRYGRLHAADEIPIIVCGNEECYCWHDIDYALHFLDNRSPKDVVNLIYFHPITRPFYQDEIRKEFHHRQPEWLAKMHASIWQHYGKGLFELFDLRRPDLWERYRQFLKEFYDIKGRSSSISPSLDKVC